MQNASIYLATPSYDGKLQDLWVAGALQFAKAFAGRHRIDILRGSFLPRLRDVLCSRFLESGASHMLCVDADIGWTVADVEALLAADKWFVGGCYAIKNDKCEVPAKLLGNGSGPVRTAEYVPAGFLLLTRACVAAMTDHYRSNRYESQYGVTTGLWTPLKGNGEDVSFCLRWREMGGDCWLHTSVHLKHVGERVFEPDVSSLLVETAPPCVFGGTFDRCFIDGRPIPDWRHEAERLASDALKANADNASKQANDDRRHAAHIKADDAQIAAKVRPWSLLFDPAVELPALFEAFRGTAAKRFLEIGTFKGATAAAMALAFPDAKIHTLDLPNTMRSEWNAQPNEQCGIAIQELGLNDRVVEWRFPSSELGGQHSHRIHGAFDLIFIDGDHSVDGCYRDLVNCSKLLNECGCLVVHDYDEAQDAKPWCQDVVKAVSRFLFAESACDREWKLTRLDGWLVKLEPLK